MKVKSPTGIALVAAVGSKTIRVAIAHRGSETLRDGAGSDLQARSSGILSL
jgi:hypothetical protein